MKYLLTRYRRRLVKFHGSLVFAGVPETIPVDCDPDVLCSSTCGLCTELCKAVPADHDARPTCVICSRPAEDWDGKLCATCQTQLKLEQVSR